MRKILLFIITLTTAMASYAQLTEDFEGTTFPPTGWTQFAGTNGLGTTISWDQSGTTNKFARCVWENVVGGTAEDWLVTPQFTVDAAAPILAFDNGDSVAQEYGSIYTVRVSTASQTTHADFTIVDTQTEAEIFHGFDFTGQTHIVDLTAYVGQAIYVAFVMTNDDGDLWIIDNVNMIANGTSPDNAVNPSPADGAMNVYINPTDGPDADTDPDMNVVISWEGATTGDLATSFDVFIGLDPLALTLGGNFSTAPFNINWGGRAYSTTYYWKVVAKNAFGESTTSPIWSFTTAADSSASVEDNVLASSVSIYPNTVTDVFTIKNSSTTALTETSIYDVNGREVFQQDLDNLIGTKTINITSLSSGMYFVELKAANAKIVKKLIKK